MEPPTLSLISIFIGLLGMCLIFLMFFIIYKKISKNKPMSIFSLVPAFLIAIYFFPEGLKNIFDLFRNLLLLIYDYFFNPESLDHPSHESIIKTVFESRFWVQAIFFFFGFLFIAYIFTIITDYFRTSMRKHLIDSLSFKNLRKNIAVAVLLLIALYFSFSSIIAIPLIKAQLDGETNLSSVLKIELDEYSKYDASLKEEYLIFSENYLSLFISDTILFNHLRLYENTIGYTWEVNLIFRELDLIKSRAVSRMQTTDNSKVNPTSRTKDKSILLFWYLDNRNYYLSYLNTLQFLIKNYANEKLSSSNESSLTAGLIYSSNFSSLIRPKATRMPAGPSMGSGLGVFTFFSGWLIDADSYPLVLIIGLIGFGLLGSGGSTFIREYENTGKPDELIIKDLPGVIIKGFTAAIVVFLGVQGGLAILTTGEAEVNAYALFFTTFVAAVFSDDTWNWAKSKFTKDFNTRRNDENLKRQDTANPDGQNYEVNQ